MILGIDIRSLADEPMTGVGVYVYELLRRLSAYSTPDTKLLPWYSGSTAVHRVISGKVSALPVETRWLRLPNRFLSALYVSPFSAPFTREFGRADYWWLPHINFVPLKVMPRYTLTIHDLSFLHLPNAYSLKRRLWHGLLKFQSLLKRADALITVSESTKAELLYYFPELASKPLRVVYPGTDHSHDQVETSTLNRAGSNYILFLGTMEPRKNVQAVLKAFGVLKQKYPDLRLVLAGSPGWSSQSLKKELLSMEGVQWLTYVDASEKKLLLRRARLLVWPSFYEGFGFPPLEALKEGVAVITSYRTSLPEILTTNVRYANPYNYVEIAALAAQILESGGLQQHTVPSRLTWKKSATELFDFITERYAYRH